MYCKTMGYLKVQELYHAHNKTGEDQGLLLSEHPYIYIYKHPGYKLYNTIMSTDL